MNHARTNANGYAFTVQTELPRQANLYENGTLPYLKRSKAQAAELAEQFGGAWRYVPGSGCRGGWSVEFPTTRDLVAFLGSTGVPVTVWIYNDSTPVPSEFDAIEFDAYRHNPETGYYDQKVSETGCTSGNLPVQ